MKKLSIIAMSVLLLPLSAIAQTEMNDHLESGSVISMPPEEVKTPLLIDSMRFKLDPMNLELRPQERSLFNDYTKTSISGASGLHLWKNASVVFYGNTSQLPGLMNTETGMVSLNQNLGRWQFTASAVANKYWMPWQNTLTTQFGFGGTMGYTINPNLSLHAYGYYYANQMRVGPAMSPYVNNTTYGGYADIRFNKTFGANVGVSRYINPMNGKWTTEPIVNPYIKIGDSKIEFPLGGLLKAFVFGNHDNPMRYQPPQPMPRSRMTRR